MKKGALFQNKYYICTRQTTENKMKYLIIINRSNSRNDFAATTPTETTKFFKEIIDGCVKSTEVENEANFIDGFDNAKIIYDQLISLGYSAEDLAYKSVLENPKENKIVKTYNVSKNIQVFTQSPYGWFYEKGMSVTALHNLVHNTLAIVVPGEDFHFSIQLIGTKHKKEATLLKIYAATCEKMGIENIFKTN